MRPSQIEAWALRVIEQVEAGQPNEDSLVELKTDWPAEPERAARRIAGHANAARGEPILWLIGVGQAAGVTGASNIDPADWYARVKSWFNELAPNMTDINIPTRSGTVIALLFYTDRSPFVVRNPVFGAQGGGPVEREIPWREGTSIRSATRYELLRILAPLQKLPSVEVLSGWLDLRTVGNVVWEEQDFEQGLRRRAREREEGLTWRLHLELYLVPRGEGRVVIPRHKCEGTFEIAGALNMTAFESTLLTPPYWKSGKRRINQSNTVDGTSTEVIVNGPGVVYLEATAKTRDLQGGKNNNAQIDLSLIPADADEPVVVREQLVYAPSGGDSWIRWWIERSPVYRRRLAQAGKQE